MKRQTDPLKKKLTRRQFIKQAVFSAAALLGGGYLLKRHFDSSVAVVDVSLTPSKHMKEAMFYSAGSKTVTCETCPHGCTLEEGELSFCRAKQNSGKKLMSISYGNPCSVNIDPIEKKPLYHFYPGTKAFSLAVAGCNFRCLNCQNWQISQTSPTQTKNYELMPDDVHAQAKKYGCTSIAYTYSEPTSFYEYMHDCAKAAKAEGIKNVWVTNGYINEKPLRELCRYIDAANVDLKSFSNETYRDLHAGSLKPVLRTLEVLHEEGVWIEITNLIIPTYTDDMDELKEMYRWIKETIGPNYPIHISRFSPLYKLTNLSATPVKKLEQARDIALKEGLHHVYIGNVPGHAASNTICQNCGSVVIRRKGYTIDEHHIEKGACSFCGHAIAGRF